MTDSFASDNKIQAQQAAYDAVAKLKTEATSVVQYQSTGHVVVISDIGDKEANQQWHNLPDPLTVEFIEYEGASSAAPNDDVSIQGALGQFIVQVSKREIKADLIVDLSPQAILSMELKPPGYFWANAAANEDGRETNTYELKQELAELVGTFEKPRYFNYDESICAHSRAGQIGCTRCIDSCPAEAITSLLDLGKNKVEVNPFRCQGGGICTTVCPPGAMTYAYPRAKDLLIHVRTLILAYIKEGGGAPDILFVTEEERSQPEQILPTSLIVVVEEVASVGPEIWLSALAWGAKSVRLFDLDGMPKSSRYTLDEHLEMTQSILIAANYPASSILLITDLSELITSSVMPSFKASTHVALSEKRAAFYMALDYLVAKSDKVKEQADLPQGSIFGKTLVDQTKCTLCMACVSACPANALQDGHEKPQLSFVEANCLQCGICVNTCPENAMSISPRLLLDHNKRKKPHVLHEDTPFCCITCGEPFATTSGIAMVITKLAGHSMFADKRSKNRLKMCDDCRVKDMMEDPNANFNP